MAKAIDIDEALELASSKSKSNSSKAGFKAKPVKGSAVDYFDEEGNRKKVHKPNVVKTTTTRDSDNPVVDKLGRNINEKLTFYLRKNPRYNILAAQKEAIQEELIKYTRNGSTDNALRCKEMLKQINASLKEIKDVMGGKSKATYLKEKEETLEAIKNSEVIKNLLTQKSEIENTIMENSASKYMTKIKDYRDQFKILGETKATVEAIDIDDALSGQKMVRDLTNASQLEIEYYNFCGEIADKIDVTVDEVMEMKPGTIGRLLKEQLEDTTELKEQLEDIKIQLAQERANLSGAKTITNFLYDMFDFKTISEEETAQAKEILALSTIPLVRGIAHKVCMDLGVLDKLDDAISYGLLALSSSIDGWMTVQLEKSEQSLSFLTYAPRIIGEVIKRGLFELNSGGTRSGSAYATDDHKKKKQYREFVRVNPEYNDVDPSIVFSLISANVDQVVIAEIKSESAYLSAGDDDYDEVMSNRLTAVSDIDVASLTEAKIEYERLLKSIKSLLDLFEEPNNPNSKKMFNKYERKLFMMHFGLEYRKDRADDGKTINNFYTQEEMAMELAAMYRANGDMKNANYRQENLAGRRGKIAKLEEKIKLAVEQNPELKIAFEFIYRYWNENAGNMVYFSNAREEVDMKIEREELKEIFADSPDILDRQLTDGKKLSDIFNVSSDNMLDETLIKMLNEYK